MKICLSRWCFMDFCVDFYGAGRGCLEKIHYQKIHRKSEGVVGTAIRNFVLSKAILYHNGYKNTLI